MKISEIYVNHMHHPVGFELKDLRIEFSIETESFRKIQKCLIISANGSEVLNTGFSEYDNNFFTPELELNPRTRYDVEIRVRDEKEETSARTFFETGKMDEPFLASWIGNDDKDIQNTVFEKNFELDGNVREARLYATGLGLYEACLDGEKVGDEYLAPGCTNYRKWVQVQTYDVTEMLTSGSKHSLTFSLGDGWYKGNMGFDGGKSEIYGNRQAMIAELHVKFEDGTEKVICSDDSWKTTSGKITRSSIYYGEDLDATIELKNWKKAEILDLPRDVLCDRLSMPIRIDERLDVVKVISTPAGETVLDFGQNQAGWLEFYNREPKGTVIKFEMGEILQNGNFYRENLRDARAAFQYTSDGNEGWVRPHFTYYGYRYVRVTGNTLDINPDDFKAAVMFSSMDKTGSLETDNKKVNRLFQNVQWGQKSNFFDVPTDCPQRDERLGWTGDADVFSNTAALNMNVFEFFKKYARDMAVEQQSHGGMLTMYAPSMGVDDGGAAVWGDAATIVPWNMYQAYGDPAILRQNYEEMKSWVDWITQNTRTENLWTGCFQFGDWIALDGENPALPTGKTDEDFIASVYYCYSAEIVSKAATILGHDEDAAFYAEKASAIRKAIQNEYITANGRLAIDTQTGYALALYFNLVPESQQQRVLNDLTARLGKDDDHLKTGFVGTPFICQVLSRFGNHRLAAKIFMNEDFPSWLYAVNMGATTVWERWNSVLEDGSMNPDGMNSLNHYSIGAIMEWGYRYLLGIRDHTPGYQKVIFSPNFDYHLKKVSGHYDSSYGRLNASYEIETDAAHTVRLNLDVPFGQTVTVTLPRAEKNPVSVNGLEKSGSFDLTCGHYEISYIPDQDFVERYTPETPVSDIMKDSLLVESISRESDVLNFFKNPENLANLGKMSLSKLNEILPFINIEPEALERINGILSSTPLLSEREKGLK